MGQKVNPNGIRLKFNSNYYSQWHTQKSNYSNLIKEDYYIRTLIKKFLGYNTYFSNIKIFRAISHYTKKSEKIKIIFQAKFPNIKEILVIFKKFKFIDTYIFKEDIKTLYKKFYQNFFVLFLLERSRYIAKILNTQFKKYYQIKFLFVKNIFSDANLTSMYLSKLIQRGMKISRLLKETLKKIKRNKNIKAAKISISGCIARGDRAQTQKQMFGSLPFNNFSSKISFAHQDLKIRRGIIGINVYLKKR